MKKRKLVQFFLIFSFSLIAIFAYGYIGSSMNKIQSGLAVHGFDRGIIVAPIIRRSEGDRATQYIAFHPTVSDGLGAIIDQSELSQIRELIPLEDISILSVTRFGLQTSNGKKSDISVFNVQPRFISMFSVKGADTLEQGFYLPSKRLFRENFNSGDIESGVLTVPDSTLSLLPDQIKRDIDWSKAKLTVKISNVPFELPASRGLFDQSLITTGKENSIKVPGVYLIPTILLVLKLREGTNYEAALISVRNFFSEKKGKNFYEKFETYPMSQFFSDEFNLAELRKWMGRIQIGCSVVFLAAVLLMFLSRYSMLIKEVWIRNAIGAPRGYSTWLSLKDQISVVCRGAVLGVFVGLILALPIFEVGISMLLPIISNIILCISVASGLSALGILAAQKRISFRTT